MKLLSAIRFAPGLKSLHNLLLQSAALSVTVSFIMLFMFCLIAAVTICALLYIPILILTRYRKNSRKDGTITLSAHSPNLHGNIS